MEALSDRLSGSQISQPIPLEIIGSIPNIMLGDKQARKALVSAFRADRANMIREVPGAFYRWFVDNNNNNDGSLELIVEIACESGLKTLKKHVNSTFIIIHSHMF